MGDSIVEPYIGRRVGNWRMNRLLGEGAFGAVYEAENAAIPGRYAAVKVLHAHLAANVGIKQRFLNEASAASRAEHENIIQVFDAGITDEGVCYVVMELLRGTTLTQVIRGGPLELRRAVNMGMQVAAALQAAHALGIVHRDLKPDNVFVVPRAANSEFVKVLDFGVAKLHDIPHDAGLTRSGMIIGTPSYMSPEQWMTLPDIDGRADIYALGMILHLCVTRTLPFVGNSPYEWLKLHCEAQPPDPTGIGTCTPAMGRLLLRMMAKRREDRPASMSEVISELRAVVSAGGGDPSRIASRATVQSGNGVPSGGTLPNLASGPTIGEELGRGHTRAGRTSGGWLVAATVALIGSLATLAYSVLDLRLLPSQTATAAKEVAAVDLALRTAAPLAVAPPDLARVAAAPVALPPSLPAADPPTADGASPASPIDPTGAAVAAAERALAQKDFAAAEAALIGVEDRDLRVARVLTLAACGRRDAAQAEERLARVDPRDRAEIVRQCAVSKILLGGATPKPRPRPPGPPGATPPPRDDAFDPEASGQEGLASQDIKTGMQQVSERVTDCFVRNNAVGKASVYITIDPSGRVQSATVRGDVEGTPAAHCIARTVESARFRKFEGKPMSTIYTFQAEQH